VAVHMGDRHSRRDPGLILGAGIGTSGSTTQTDERAAVQARMR
jgi:hypothetical protein